VGELILLAARPSLGKTTLALNIATSVARRGLPVLIFSLEQSGEELVGRMLASEARLDLMDINRGRLRNESDWAELAEARSSISALDLGIFETGIDTPTAIRTRARRAFGMKEPGLVVIDYLQLLDDAQQRENRNHEVGAISRSLKRGAKELGCPILALSQLNRQVDQRSVKRPVLSDLRDSGSLEQDADVVIFLHSETGSDPADRGEGSVWPTETIVAKNRNGPTGTTRLGFHPAHTRFASLEQRQEG
jgi:replicative DNA helicase